MPVDIYTTQNRPDDSIAAAIMAFTKARQDAQKMRYERGRQEQQDQLTKMLTDLKVSEFETKQAEAKRLRSLAEQYASGAMKAPEGTVYDPLQQKLIKTTPSVMWGGGMGIGLPTMAQGTGTIPQGQQSLPNIPTGAVGVDADGNWVDAQGNVLGRAE